MKIYANQSNINLILETNIDFTTVLIDSASIDYIKPSGLTGSWAVVTSGSSMIVEFNDAVKFNEPGVWKLNPIIVQDSLINIGDTVEILVYYKGE